LPTEHRTEAEPTALIYPYGTKWVGVIVAPKAKLSRNEQSILWCF